MASNRFESYEEKNRQSGHELEQSESYRREPWIEGRCE
jgi:hypothetical protein